MEQFNKHIKILNNPEYNMIDLETMVSAIKNKIKIPDRSVSITIDDAFLSVYENAWPIFRENGIKFTLFVSTDVIDRKLPNYMSWDQIRELMLYLQDY